LRERGKRLMDDRKENDQKPKNKNKTKMKWEE
jgi:hypothetical protein